MSQASGSSGSSVSKDDRTTAMLAHLLGIIILVPLIIWLMKKDASSFIGENAKEALNFQLMFVIAYVAASILSCIPFIGLLAFVLIFVLFVVDVVLSIMGAMAANRGELYRYPFGLRLIK